MNLSTVAKLEWSICSQYRFVSLSTNTIAPAIYTSINMFTLLICELDEFSSYAVCIYFLKPVAIGITETMLYYTPPPPPWSSVVQNSSNKKLYLLLVKLPIEENKTQNSCIRMLGACPNENAYQNIRWHERKWYWHHSQNRSIENVPVPIELIFTFIIILIGSRFFS